MAGVDQTGTASDFDGAVGERDLPIAMGLRYAEHGDAAGPVRELVAERVIPSAARRLCQKALQSERKGRLEEALGHAGVAVEIAHSFSGAHAALAAGYLTSGRLDQAQRHIETALNLNPDYLQARSYGAWYSSSGGDSRKPRTP